MNDKNLMICDKEFLYAEGLCENVSARSEFALKVYACTCLENVLRFQRKQKIHILIIDERFSSEERKEIEAEQVYVLTKDRCRDLQDREKEIFKFQSADKILAKVFEPYCERMDGNMLKSVRKQRHRMIAVYSPIHRIGKTTFALTLGKEAAKKEKTLYLNMEAYADIGGDAQEQNYNLGDLLYYMRQEKGNFALRLASAVAKQEELDYIAPIANSMDLKEVSQEEWCMFLQKILQESVYEVIVLDMSECMQGICQVLQMCDRIYMPVLEDERSERKVQRYREELTQLQCAEILEKTYQFAVTESMEEHARKIAKEEW